MKLILRSIFCLIIFAAITIWLQRGVHSDGGVITLTQLNAMMDGGRVQSVGYDFSTKEVIVRSNAGLAEVLDSPLSNQLFQKILRKKLNSTLFLGPISGFGKNSVFDSETSKTPSAKDLSSFNLKLNSITETLAVSAMGINAGYITLTPGGVRVVRNKLCSIEKLAMDTRPSFSFYSVHDSSTTCIDAY